ncbi:cysteine desulfurase family protein [Acanthopleuribacter pedis]|uniref:cysteine desulfurase n=1 Tax=Acanthopleuribacter pedis TaxID=442870 RepID=A0A8J7U407_9BACT|nr:IscS subfamily cysteine desulfurase [Acanthopleuribacter pedis]MBO1317826.1 IscS subfamily cysteine desulfurase [Acanthopleuribacter pedis]
MTTQAVKTPVYLDYHATTPVDKRVFDAMHRYFCEEFGNAASSEHRFGWMAEAAVKQARQTIAETLSARRPAEIIFTSGATESNNLAILGAMHANAHKGDHLISVVTEHKAVLDPCAFWAQQGGRVTLLPVNRQGLIDLEALEAAIDEGTVLISVMAANNEIGVLQDLNAIGALAKRRGVLFHTDAAQAAGKIPLDVEAMGIDLLSVSAHKFYGPKGVGALYVRRRNPRVRLQPLLFGGGHEEGLRSGTLNVPGIVGMAKALELAAAEMDAESTRLAALRDRLWHQLQKTVADIEISGCPERRLPGNLHVRIADVEPEKLLTALKDVALSSRSACTSASQAPSHVMAALGLDRERLQAAVRFGLGRFTTEAEIDYVATRVAETVGDLRRENTVGKNT